MGEWMIQVPVKLDAATVERLDLLRGAYPFKPGRSTVIRELVEEGLRLISEGILQFRASTSNRVPSVQSIPGTPSTPNEFPAASEPQTAGQCKPPVRVSARRSNGGRESRYVSRMDVANQAWFTSLRIHSTPLNERVA